METRPISTIASDNAHFIGFPAQIYKWLKQRQKERQLRSIPAVVNEIVREAFLSERSSKSKAA